jgi:hypothetical protein
MKVSSATLDLDLDLDLDQGIHAKLIQTFYNTYAICAFAAIGGGLYVPS